jgi:hypothetical protein
MERGDDSSIVLVERVAEFVGARMHELGEFGVGHLSKRRKSENNRE